MTMPGFEAEASLSKGSRWRTADSGNYPAVGSSIVQPAQLRGCFLNCEQICEGDLVGACMPWCLCRCHGGTHCGLPS